MAILSTESRMKDMGRRRKIIVVYYVYHILHRARGPRMCAACTILETSGRYHKSLHIDFFHGGWQLPSN